MIYKKYTILFYQTTALDAFHFNFHSNRFVNKKVNKDLDEYSDKNLLIRRFLLY